MKAKYCPCLGVKISAVGRGDIGEDFWIGRASNQEAPIKVHYRLKRSEVECCRLPPAEQVPEPTVRKLKLPRFWPAALVSPPKRWE
jgi:hypothetical protein